MHPMFNTNGVQTHELQVMDSTFSVLEMLVFTTEPSWTALQRKNSRILLKQIPKLNRKINSLTGVFFS